MKKEEPDYKKHLKGIVLNLPETPGIYQYIDENGTILHNEQVSEIADEPNYEAALAVL